MNISCISLCEKWLIHETQPATGSYSYLQGLQQSGQPLFANPKGGAHLAACIVKALDRRPGYGAAGFFALDGQMNLPRNTGYIHG